MTTDMAYDSATLLTGQSLVIMPSSSADHWIIHNVVLPFGSTCEIYWTDGTNTILIMNTSTSLLSYNFHVNTSSYYTVKNIGTSSINVSYDGVIV